ncbi:unnamed protein product [Boreogadus saida]
MTRGRPRHVSVFVYFVRLFFLFLLIQQSLSDETGDLRPCNEEADGDGYLLRRRPLDPGAPSGAGPPGPVPPDCSPGSGGAPAGPPPGAPAVDLPSPERTFQKDVPNAAFKERRVPALRVRPGRPSTAARSSDASFPVPTATSLCSFTTNNHSDSTTLVCCLCAFGLAPSAAPHHL